MFSLYHYKKIAPRFTSSFYPKSDRLLAVKLLQDRERMVRSIINGNGERGNDHPIGPAYGIDHCEDIEIRPLDLDKAKFHLKRSGITECEVHGTDGVTGGIEPMLMLKEAAAKAGLTVNVKREPYDGYWGNVWMQKPIHQTNWNMRPTASIMLEFAYHPEAPWNESVWKNERMGMLLESSRSAVDSGQRKELLCEMQRLVRDDAGTAIPFHTDYVDGISDHVKDKPRVPLGPLGGGEWPEFVWLDS